MATIKVGRLPIVGSGHLYFELYDDAGQRIKQINAYGTDPTTGNPLPLSGDSGFVKIFDDRVEGGDIIKTVFTGTEADIYKALSYIQAFKDFINPNSEYLPYRAVPDSAHYNSNSGFNTLGNIISLAVAIDQTALQQAKDTGALPNFGVTNDILRGQSWAPIFDGVNIVGSRVTGTSGADKMDNGKDGNDTLIGGNGNDIFSSIPANTYRPTIPDYHGPDGANTIYGGGEANKVLFDFADGKDAYFYDPLNGTRSVEEHDDHYEVLIAGNALDTDTLYSIEIIAPKIWLPENKIDFRNINNGSLKLQNLTSTELADLRSEYGTFITTAVKATVNGETSIIGNFGTIVGTGSDDTFMFTTLPTSLQKIDAGAGYDALSFSSLGFGVSVFEKTAGGFKLYDTNGESAYEYSNFESGAANDNTTFTCKAA